jgi:hypothetical protein
MKIIENLSTKKEKEHFFVDKQTVFFSKTVSAKNTPRRK